MVNRVWARRRNASGRQSSAPIKLSLCYTSTDVLLSIIGDRITTTYEVPLAEWRKLLDSCEKSALAAKERGPVAKLTDVKNAMSREI